LLEAVKPVTRISAWEQAEKYTIKRRARRESHDKEIASEQIEMPVTMSACE
jgi:hypothetical protein